MQTNNDKYFMELALDEAHVITYEKYDVLTLACGYSEYQKFLPIIRTFDAVIDDTVFEADVKLCFAMKSGAMERLDKKLAESSFGKYTLIKEGERFDYR